MNESESLESLRTKINEIDMQIVELLGKRTECSKKVASFKKTQKINILQSERESEVFGKIKQLSQDNGLDQEFTKSVFVLILNYSKKIQAEQLESQN
jgi:chorismate mutase